MIAFHLVHQIKNQQTTERARYNCILYPWVLTVSVSIEISILWSCENKRMRKKHNEKAHSIAYE